MIFTRYIKDTFKFKRFLIEALVLMFIASGIQLLLPQFIRTMLDEYIPNKQVQKALVYFLVIIGAFLVRAVVIVRRNHRMLHYGYGFIYHLRMRIMRHLQLLSSRYYDKVPMGDIITRMLDDIMNVENMTTNCILTIVTDCIIIIGVLIFLFFMEWTLALAALAVMPFYLLNFKYFRKRLRQRNRAIQRHYADLSTEFSESVTGVRVIKSFSLEEFKGEKLERFFCNDVAMRIKTYTMNAVFHVISEFLTILGTAVILFYGGFLVMQGRITVGEVVAFYTYVGYLYNPLLQIVNMTQVIQRGLASIERVYELLDTRPWPPEKKGAKDPRPLKGLLEFRNVTFFYERSKLPSLSDISFKVSPGKTTALVGASGAGKSTILNLILRFYDPTTGQILIDNGDIRDFKINLMRHCMSIVLQEGFLFSGSIYDNIRMGRLAASDQEVEEAAKRAQAWDFIQSLPSGMHTEIGEQGINLSGGQQQLIAMARAMLRNAPIVLMDEPTSAMDSETEHRVQQSLGNLRRNSATIIIAHRLSTIRMADEILVMQQGKIVERGQHNTLIEKGGYYRRLCDLQFKGTVPA
jgi:subfamily B ATP-binding cassette protein MsbA